MITRVLNNKSKRIMDDKNKYRLFLCRYVLLLPLLVGSAWAGNLQISNIQKGLYNYATGDVQVKFDVSWENSWRLAAAPSNWDSVWLFVKYRKNSGAWQHARLNSSGHIAPSGMTINAKFPVPSLLRYKNTPTPGLVEILNPLPLSTNPALIVIPLGAICPLLLSLACCHAPEFFRYFTNNHTESQLLGAAANLQEFSQLTSNFT